MNMDKIQIGKWYLFEKLDHTGNNKLIRSGIVREKYSTIVKLENASGIQSCFYNQIISERICGHSVSCPLCDSDEIIFNKECLTDREWTDRATSYFENHNHKYVGQNVVKAYELYSKETI